MIKINLLPVREAKRQASIRRQGIFLGIAVGIGVLISAGLNLSVAAEAKAKQTEIAKAQADLTKLKETRAEVDRYRKEKEEIERKLLVISRLDKNRTGQVRILDEVATRIPERMWIEKLTFKDSEMLVKGVSIDAEVVAEFLSALSESPLISDVELEGTTVQDTNGLLLNKFSVRCKLALGDGSKTVASAGK